MDESFKQQAPEHLASFPPDLAITTTEMHTGGEPLRIIESGYPQPEGSSVLEKRAWLLAHADHYRKLVMFEPRGHYDMYGALLVTPDLPGADLGIIFMHNAGYSTMCGHAIIALGRYVVDRGLVPAVSPQTAVVFQCPCGPVTAYVTYENGVSSDVRFTSVPSYVFAIDLEVAVPGVGKIKVDISYGGAFYALVPAARLGLNLDTDPTDRLSRAAFTVTAAVRDAVSLRHPDSHDLAFLYGTILTDGGDHGLLADSDDYDVNTTSNVCVFADREVDRSPCGSGVAARVALQYHRGLLPLQRVRHFRSAVTGSKFRGRALREVEVAGAGPEGESVVGVVVEVAGRGHYCGSSKFILESDDPLAAGFLPR